MPRPRSGAPLLAAAVASLAMAEAGPPPLALHPENPRYFLWRGKPTIVITSGEHYGAVLNLDFDYRKYLDTLARDGMNATRTFAGTYVETGGDFAIAANTLDPAPGRFISPWARSSTPGYADGGNKFDLRRWDEAFFDRLRDFLAHASEKGVIVELTLFCPLYEESMWRVSPMNPANNVGGLGPSEKEHVLTLDKSGALLPLQEALARRMVEAVAGFDNVILEICNEPYAKNVPADWQRRLATVVQETVAKRPAPVLISQNVANYAERIVDPHPAVSVFNFHYATPPDAVGWNAHLGKVIGDNETGFRGTADLPYRTEAWEFILAGGGAFNHLDYSFTVGHEDGTFRFPPTQPGGGGPTIRRQLRVLRDFVLGFDFVRMKPDTGFLREGVPASGEYALHTSSNDGVRLRLDDRAVIQDWTDHSEKEDTAVARLEAGRAHRLTLEYFYNGGQGAMKLAWTPPGAAKQTVPKEALRGPDGSEGGLRGEYFHGNALERAWFTRVDPQVDFAFGTRGPLERRVDDGGAALVVDLPAGSWRVTWLDPVSGQILKDQTSAPHAGGALRLEAPAWTDDVAVAIRRLEAP